MQNPKGEYLDRESSERRRSPAVANHTTTSGRGEIGAKPMFDTPLKRLRKKSWLSDIPDSIDIPAIGGRPATTKPIEEASLDDLAFAIRALSKQSSAIYRKTNALQQIYDLARNEGALGNMLAVPAAARAEEVA